MAETGHVDIPRLWNGGVKEVAIVERQVILINKNQHYYVPTTHLLTTRVLAQAGKMASWKMKMALNMIGQQVKRVRTRLGWSQSFLATRLQLSGWDISRSGVSKIEDRAVYVHDFQITWLAAVLGVPREALYPKLDSTKPIQDLILQHIRNPRRNLVPPSVSLTHLS